jgi:hypothetical protein
MPDEAHNCVADGERSFPGRLEDPAQRLVSQDQVIATRARPAVGTANDLFVGPAHPDGHGLDEDRSFLFGRLGDLPQGGALRPLRDDRDALHSVQATSS